MDTEEWEDLIEAHAWYNGASQPPEKQSPEKQKRARASIDASADR